MELHSSASCPVCDQQLKRLDDYLVLGKYPTTLRQCASCEWAGFIEPDWLPEAYTSAIAATDTGAAKRSLAISESLSCLLIDHSLHLSKCLDYGGGAGLLVRIMRDKGFDFLWEDRYCPNIFAQGFEVGGGCGVDVITLFEVLEHLQYPLQTLAGLAKEHAPKLVVFSTVLYQAPRPSTDWWYLSPDTGQHISFFTEKTLRHIASCLSASYFNYMGFHCFAFSDILSPATRQDGILARVGRKIERNKRMKNMKSKTLSDHRLLLSKLNE